METALILFLLFALLFGIVEFSVLLFDKAVITNAAREGARLGAMFNVDAGNNFVYSPYTDAQIEQRVRDYCEQHLVSFGASATPVITISPDWATRREGASGSRVQVTVDYRYTFAVLPNLAGNLAGGTDLEAEATMRME